MVARRLDTMSLLRRSILLRPRHLHAVLLVTGVSKLLVERPNLTPSMMSSSMTAYAVQSCRPRNNHSIPLPQKSACQGVCAKINNCFMEKNVVGLRCDKGPVYRAVYSLTLWY
jgi:hypothetical protein